MMSADGYQKEPKIINSTRNKNYWVTVDELYPFLYRFRNVYSCISDFNRVSEQQSEIPEATYMQVDKQLKTALERIAPHKHFWRATHEVGPSIVKNS